MSLSVNMLLKQQQKLVMTPQMQQSIKLLQLNTLQMEHLARQEMLENPFLEVEEEEETATDDENESVEEPDLSSETDIPATDSQPETQDNPSETSNPEIESEQSNESFDKVDVDWDDVYSDSENSTYYPTDTEEETDFTQYTAAKIGLYEDLNRQLNLSGLEGDEYEIGKYLIGNINEDGYLETSIEEAAEALGKNVEDVERVLSIIQTFDPDGIGARNLNECLILQLQARGEDDPRILDIVHNHLSDLQQKKFAEIARKTGMDKERLSDIYNLVGTLEPKPGRVKSKEEPHYITPDVYVKEVDGKYMYYLNEGESAHLRINSYYRNLLKSPNTMSPDERTYATERYKSAVWLLRNIEKRRSTILKVTEAIMDYQKDFLEKGIEHLKPLTLKQIADIVEMHESTVQRVTSGKYVDTPRGLFELKFFFSSGLATSNNATTSSLSIKDEIARLIENEDPAKPLSDQGIATILQEKGIKIARRTVAKYREQMKILPTKMRKTV